MGDFRGWAARAARILFCAQCDNRIDVRRATRRNEDGQGRDGEEDQCHRHVHDGIIGWSPVQKVANDSADSKRREQTESRSDADDDQRISDHHPAHAHRLGAERHANPDLTRPLRDSVAHHAKETHASKTQRQRRERAEHRAPQPLLARPTLPSAAPSS